MHGWPVPPEFPLSELVGQEVTQVCVGLGQVSVHLYRQPQPGTPDKWKPGARIDVESAFTIQEDASGSTRVEPARFKVAGGTLTRLLGATVAEVIRGRGSEIQVVFAGGFSLHLHTDPQGFESFHLQISGESVTVTGAPSEV